jgi:hypothetical protein
VLLGQSRRSVNRKTTQQEGVFLDDPPRPVADSMLPVAAVLIHYVGLAVSDAPPVVDLLRL